MPVCEPFIRDDVDSLWLPRVCDIKNDAVPGASPRGNVRLRKNGDVMTLIGLRRLLGAITVITALP